MSTIVKQHKHKGFFMKKHYILSLVLVSFFAQNILGMDQENNEINPLDSNNESFLHNNIQINTNNIQNDDQILENNINQNNIIQQQVQVNTVFNNLGENTINVAFKLLRKVQKNTGYLSVASESNGERQNRINNFNLMYCLKDLSEDAKKGGFISASPSLFKQANDRIHENNRQAQVTLVDMHDKKSLDVGQLNLSKQYIDNSKAYSEALYNLLDTAYNEKYTEIQKNINQKSSTHQEIVENNNNDKEDK